MHHARCEPKRRPSHGHRRGRPGVEKRETHVHLERMPATNGYTLLGQPRVAGTRAYGSLNRRQKWRFTHDGVDATSAGERAASPAAVLFAWPVIGLRRCSCCFALFPPSSRRRLVPRVGAPCSLRSFPRHHSSLGSLVSPHRQSPDRQLPETQPF